MSAITALPRESRDMPISRATEAHVPPETARAEGKWSTPRSIEWGYFTIFAAIHLGALGALLTGVTWGAVAFLVIFYLVGMFAITGGYHRYFSHRTYKTSRVFQFILAFLAQSTAQRGVLWWAAHHRRHHRASDTPDDLHSPRQDGFWYAHVLWIYNRNGETNLAAVRDLAKYPELRFLDRVWWLPPWVVGLSAFLIGGLPMLCFGFFLGLVVLWHATFTINSLAHVYGSQRFDTGDDSRNNFWLALLTLGEGWHNNHHHHMGSTRQGFYPGEIDITYGVLRLLSRLGLVWNLREPPQAVLDEGRGRDRRAHPPLTPPE